MTRLSAASVLPRRVESPAYAPEAHGAGILHIGLGAFARAHLCDYTDGALGIAGGDWRVIGANLRSTDLADALNAQDGRYSLQIAEVPPKLRVVGALSHVLAGPDVAARIVAQIADPAIRIISFTVSESGYGLTRAGGCDLSDPVVAHDLANPDRPKGVLGIVLRGLHERFRNEAGPVTLLSCDNLPDNGRLLRAAVLDFATRAYGDKCAAEIAVQTSFPSSMVDRITPRVTPEVLDLAAAGLGLTDAAALATEPFAQWVIEDDFIAGRPAWDRAGVTFTKDVAKFERMKLRMLNGAHSFMAYLGQLRGKMHVRDVMADPALADLVGRYLDAAAATLDMPQADIATYRAALIARFANPAIAHATAQIAMDGSAKMPQRIFAPALEAQTAGGDLDMFAYATAAWITYLARGDFTDPRAAEITARLEHAHGQDAARYLLSMPDLVPTALLEGHFPALVTQHMTNLAKA